MDEFALKLVSVRNMLTFCGMSMPDNKKDLLAIKDLFDCATCQTQGSSAEMVYEAIAASFLFGHYYLHCFCNTFLYRYSD